MDAERLIEAVRQFGAKRVLVLGDVMLDVYDFCSTADSKAIESEMPGKRAYRAHKSIQVLGGAGNVAANLAALDARTSLIGVTGDDGHHVTLQRIAQRHGIAHCLIRDHTRPTTVKTRLYVDDTYLLRRDDEVADEVNRDVVRTIQVEFLEQLPECDAVVLSDYDKGFFTRTGARQIVDACIEQDVPVVVDFKPPNASYFANASLIAPNEAEADILQPGFAGSADLEEKMGRLHEQLGCRHTAVTLGERGLCGTNGETFFHVGGRRVAVVDSVGCGDTVRAALALGMVSGLSVEDSAVLANFAASTIIRKRATATLSADEVIAEIAAER